MNKSNSSIKDFISTNKAIFYTAMLYLTAMTAYVTIKLYSFSYFNMDLAFQAQSINQILEGSLFSSIIGSNFLAQSGRCILFLLAPFYFIFNSPLFLLYIQNICITISAVIIYKIALLHLKPKWAFLCALLFLIHPATISGLIYEFHTEVLATLFLTMMIFYFLKEQYKLFVLSSVLAALCTENIALTVMAFGTLAFFKKKTFKWWLPTIIIGGGCYILYVLCIQPATTTINASPNSLQLFIGAIKDPIKILAVISEKDFILFVQLLAPFAFLIIRPAWAFILIPLYLNNMLSNTPETHSIAYQHYTVFIPFLAICFINSVKYLLDLTNNKTVSKALFISLCLGTISMSIIVNPIIPFLDDPIKKLSNPLNQAKHALLQSIPKNAVACASMEFLPFLLKNKNIYSFHHILDNDSLPNLMPENVDFMLFDTKNMILQQKFINKDSHSKIKTFLQKNNLFPVSFYENIILFEKNANNTIPPIQLSEEPLATQNKEVTFEDKLKLINSQVDYQPSTNTLDISLTFKTLIQPSSDYWIFFKTVNSNSENFDNTYMPLTFLLHPTSIWNKGETFQIRHRILIDKHLSKGTYYIGFMLFDKKTKKIIVSDKNHTAPNALAKIKTA